MITRKQQEKIVALGKKHQLDFIILYGSSARKKAGDFSDLDLALYRRKIIKPEEYFEIYSQLAEVFKSLDLDLKLLQGADPLFRFLVVRDGRLLYGNRTAYNFYRAFAYRSFQEAKPLFELEEFLIKKNLNLL